MKPATSLCFWRNPEGTKRCTSASPPSAARMTAQTTITPYTTLIIRESPPFGQARRRPPPYKPGGADEQIAFKGSQGIEPTAPAQSWAAPMLLPVVIGASTIPSTENASMSTPLGKQGQEEGPEPYISKEPGPLRSA